MTSSISADMSNLIAVRYCALEAANNLLIAYHFAAHGYDTSVYHREAMEQIDKMADLLGLELVAPENVKGGR